jgi:hypothetical protein
MKYRLIIIGVTAFLLAAPAAHAQTGGLFGGALGWLDAIQRSQELELQRRALEAQRQSSYPLYMPPPQHCTSYRIDDRTYTTCW